MLLKNSPEILSKKNQSYLCSKYCRPTRDKKDVGVALKGGSTTPWHGARFCVWAQETLNSYKLWDVPGWVLNRITASALVMHSMTYFSTF